MAAIGDGVGDYLRTAATFTPLTAAYSWAFWYLPTGAPASGGTSRHPFALTNSGGSNPNGYDINFAWDHNDAAFYKAAIHHNAAGGTFAKAQHPGTPASSGWHHVAAVFNGTTLKLYYDGIEVASVAASAPPSGDGNPELTVCSYNNVTGFDDQAVAEMAIWSVALTAAEVYSVATGTAASSVQGGSLVSYSHLNDGDITTTGNALTNSGTVINTTYFFGQTGGPAIGGENLSAPAVYTWEPSGGPAIGGANMISPAVYGWTPTGGVAFGGANMVAPVVYNWTPSGGLAIGGPDLSAPTVYHETMSGGMSIGGTSDAFLLLGNGAFVIAEERSMAQTKR